MTSKHPDPAQFASTGRCRVPCELCGVPANPAPPVHPVRP